MGNPVGLVKCRYGRDEGGEGRDCMAGKGSVFAVSQMGALVECGERGLLLGLKLIWKNQICVAK